MNEKLRVLIADDEQAARNKLSKFLKSREEVALIYEAANGNEAVEVMKAKKPDLVFLDIQMPGKNGFEVIEAIGPGNMPVVVFVTAYDQYAIKAFEVQALDYLLKPFDDERFERAFKRALSLIQKNDHNTPPLRMLLDEIGKTKKLNNKILVNKGEKFFFIGIPEIVYIESNEKYAEVYTQNDKYLIRESMKSLEEKLDLSVFVRIHRCYIVNINYIKDIEKWSHGEFLLTLLNGRKFRVSRNYKDNLINFRL
ncbi:MAG TPA: LytTR family DNA-binding domain-containing protein [Ignavibacteriales bacterium]|nr:LytTR family DNA-binding domain-containing protein [Ignavibacteriales bacterium]